MWLVDYLYQFLTSPLWDAAIDTFIEENCITFEDREENNFEHFKIHKVQCLDSRSSSALATNCSKSAFLSSESARKT